MSGGFCSPGEWSTAEAAIREDVKDKNPGRPAVSGNPEKAPNRREFSRRYSAAMGQWGAGGRTACFSEVKYTYILSKEADDGISP